MKRNLKGSKITDSRGMYYVSFKFSDFGLKIGSIGGAKFGSAQKMSYLCTRNHESNKAVSGGPMQIVAKYLIPCKNTFKHYGKDFV